MDMQLQRVDTVYVSNRVGTAHGLAANFNTTLINKDIIWDICSDSDLSWLTCLQFLPFSHLGGGQNVEKSSKLLSGKKKKQA